MRAEQQKVMPCYVCGSAPIRRICLADQILANGKYLFCDNCRKQDVLRKHASQIYQIDSFSAPLSLLSINSTQKILAQKVYRCVQSCRQSAQVKAIPVYELLGGIDDRILKKIQQLSSTFDSDTSQQMQEQLKFHPPAHRQLILGKVMILKWVKQNKDMISNPSILSQKIANFSRDFQAGIETLYNKIQQLLSQFFSEFNMDYLFAQRKKQQKHEIYSKQPSVTSRNSKKIISQNSKQPNRKQLTEEKAKLQKINEPMKDKTEKSEKQSQKMELQNDQPLMKVFNNPKGKQSVVTPKDSGFEKLIFSPHSIKQDKNQEEQKQKDSIDVKQSESKLKNKKPSAKPIQKSEKSISEEQANKPPPLILEPVCTKSDYLDQQKLIINLKNIAQVFWILNEEDRKQNMQVKPPKDPKLKYQNSSQKIVEDKNRPNNSIDTRMSIKLDQIKYLEIQELPKRLIEHFTVNIDGKYVKVKYSLQTIYEKINLMENLEQIHIFSSILFSSESEILTMLFTCSNIKVMTFSCFNSVSKMLPRFKEMVGNIFNEEVKVLQMAGNIPFWQNIEIADVKLYFPESEKNKKIFDEKFSNNFQLYIQTQKKWIEGNINEKEKFQHRNSCWFVPHERTQIQPQRICRILEPYESKLLAECFRQLRSCWIPYLTTECLTEKQQSINIQKIQHLTLGFHYFVLQPIPEKFYFSDKAVSGSQPFCKYLTNLKSLNLINLNINQFIMKRMFCSNWKEILSLKIQNCMGLTNQFYKNLPKYCPKLRKIFVNNLQSGIQGDFLTKLQHLETIILPWSQLIYKRSDTINEIENSQKPLMKGESELNGIQNGPLESLKLKKWRYVNLYGCSWFHTDFFALMDPETLEHLNIGKCPKLFTEDLVYYLKRFTNLESLCLDETDLNNKDLFIILRQLPKLTRLSIAHCPNINLGFMNLESEGLEILDRMTHLDLRNHTSPIAYQYTMSMVNPKYLIMSRGFELQENQPETLAQRQITACSYFA